MSIKVVCQKWESTNEYSSKLLEQFVWSEHPTGLEALKERKKLSNEFPGYEFSCTADINKVLS